MNNESLSGIILAALQKIGNYSSVIIISSPFVVCSAKISIYPIRHCKKINSPELFSTPIFLLTKNKNPYYFFVYCKKYNITLENKRKLLIKIISTK